MQEAIDAIIQSFVATSLEHVLQFKFQLRLYDIVPQNDGFTNIVYNLLMFAERKGWIKELLLALRADNPNNTQLDECVTDIIDSNTQMTGTASNTEIDPHVACVLSDRVFINRTDLRHHMRKFTEADHFDPRLLVINGPVLSGKTFTQEFVRYLAYCYNKLNPVYVSLTQWPGANCSPDDLMDCIRSRLNMPPDDYPVNDLAQGSRRALKLVDWFVGKAQALDVDRWLIVDDLDHSGVSEESKDLINFLAQEVARKNIPNLRLILLGFDQPFEPILARDIMFETLSPIDETTIRLHAREIAGQYLESEDDILTEGETIFQDASRNLDWPLNLNNMITLSTQFDEAVFTFLERTS